MPQARAMQFHAPKFRPIDSNDLQSDGSLAARLFRANASRTRAASRENRNPTGFDPITGAPRHLDLSAALAAMDAPAGSPNGAFRFERRGNVAREIPRGYNRMCNALSAHIWSEPEGKRLCFDVRGKPGIAIQIPFH